MTTTRDPDVENFNLLTQPWIPILRHDGTYERVGIKTALLEAGNIRQLAAANPMDRVALLRFLLAVVYWYEPAWPDNDGRRQLVSASRFSDDCMMRLENDRQYFNLLGKPPRFMQDPSLRGDAKPRMGDLLVDFPGKDSVNHTRHVLHGSYGFCPACCAMGMLRLSVWAPANQHYPASVNPPSAAYAIVPGGNLLETLSANSPPALRQATPPPWLTDTPSAAPLGPSTAFAWRPRKFWLGDPAEEGLCEHCAEPCHPIRTLALYRGWATPRTDRQAFGKLVEDRVRQLGYRIKDKHVKKALNVWPLIVECRLNELPEPHLSTARRSLEAARTSEQKAAAVAQILDVVLKQDDHLFRSMVRPANKEEKGAIGTHKEKMFWDDDPLLLHEQEPISLPGLADKVSAHARFWRKALAAHAAKGNARPAVAIGPVVNKFVYQDAVSIPLPAAPADTPAKLAVSEAIVNKLEQLLKNATPNPKRSHPEISHAVTSLEPATEAEIRQVLLATGVAPADAHHLRRLFEPTLRHVVASTRGSLFQRRLALAEACRELERLIARNIRESASDAGPDKERTT